MAKKHHGGHAHTGHHDVKAPHHHLSSHAKHIGHDAVAHSGHHSGNKEVGAGSFDSPHEYEDGGNNHHLGENVCHED